MINFNKKIHRGIIAAVILIEVVGLAALGLSSYSTALANAASFSGRATAVQANILPRIPILGLPIPGQTITLVDTGPLPSIGGVGLDSLPDASVLGLLTAGVLHAATVGIGSRSDGEASIADLALTVGGNTIGAGFLMAQAAATCATGTPPISAGSQVQGLTVNGIAIPVTTAQNQIVNLVGGRIVVNERSSAGGGEVTVTALHIIVNNVADIALARASAGVTCPGQLAVAPVASFVPRVVYASDDHGDDQDDFVTGSGKINGTPTGAKGTFGVSGGIDDRKVSGHLSYSDQGSNTKVEGLKVTGYCAVDATTRRITGTAKVNKQNGFTYTVEVSDKTRPRGHDNDDDKCRADTLDTFSIKLSNGYMAQGNLRDGNIRLHTERDDYDDTPVPPCTPPPTGTPPTVTLGAVPSIVPTGTGSSGTSTATWSSTDATTCIASTSKIINSGTGASATSDWTGARTLSGSLPVNFTGIGPGDDIDFVLTLTCAGPGGTAAASTTVNVFNETPS